MGKLTLKDRFAVVREAIDAALDGTGYRRSPTLTQFDPGVFGEHDPANYMTCTVHHDDVTIAQYTVWDTSPDTVCVTVSSARPCITLINRELLAEGFVLQQPTAGRSSRSNDLCLVHNAH